MQLIIGLLSGVLGMIAGWYGLAALMIGLLGPDRDGGLAMGAFFNIGPIGGLVGFVAGVFLFIKKGRAAQVASSPDAGRSEAATRSGGPQPLTRTRLSRPFAFVVLAVSGGLVWLAWYEFIRSPYLTHGADAEMTLSLQFRLPPGMASPEHSEDLYIEVDDGDGHAFAIYGDKWFGPGKWYRQDGDRTVLLASAELNKITYWRRVVLTLPDVPATIWTLDLDSDPYPIPDYTPWRQANGAPASKIELRYRLTADRCAVCAFENAP